MTLTMQLSSMIDTVAAAKGYAAAARLQEEMRALIKDEDAAAASLQEAFIKRRSMQPSFGRRPRARRRSQGGRMSRKGGRIWQGVLKSMQSASGMTSSISTYAATTAAGEWNARAGQRWRTCRTWPPSCPYSPDALRPIGHRRRQVRSNLSATGQGETASPWGQGWACSAWGEVGFRRPQATMPRHLC